MDPSKFLNIPVDPPYGLGIFKWFWMPTSHGLVRAVAVSSSDASLLIAGYALLLILTLVGFARIFKEMV